MGFTSQYIESSKCLLQYLSGSVSIEDLKVALDDLLQHVNHNQDVVAILPDLSGVTEFNVSSNEMMNFAGLTATKSKDISNTKLQSKHYLLSS